MIEIGAAVEDHLLDPGGQARSATSLPTAAAAALSAPVFNSAFSVASSVEAAAKVRPCVSSMIWAYMFLPDRNTDRRGRPCDFCLIW